MEKAALPLLDNTPLRGERVENFFENLLPDSSAIRTRLAKRHAAVSEDTFDLLAAIGRDCAGAVQLLLVDESRGRAPGPGLLRGPGYNVG